MAFRSVPPEEICARGYGRMRAQVDCVRPHDDLNLTNLVLWAKSRLNGFAGKDSKLSWSTGVLEYWKKLKPGYRGE